jgi:hypothetical protein
MEWCWADTYKTADARHRSVCVCVCGRGGGGDLVGIDCTIMEESGKVCGYRERKRGKEKADGGPGGRSGGGWQPLHLR